MARTTQLKRETPRSEDYLEAIYHLIQDKGYAGTVDIADNLRIKPPSVSSMIHKLAAEGYLEHKAYRGMRLTDEGEKIARSVIAKHNIISEFLSMIGVKEGTADEDAEGIEHHIQPITFRKIERLVDFLRKNPSYLRAIRDYLEK